MINFHHFECIKWVRSGACGRHKGTACSNAFSVIVYEVSNVLAVGLHTRHIGERWAFLVGICDYFTQESNIFRTFQFVSFSHAQKAVARGCGTGRWGPLHRYRRLLDESILGKAAHTG